MSRSSAQRALLLGVAALFVVQAGRSQPTGAPAFTPRQVTALVRDYEIKDDLSNVSNRAQLPKLEEGQHDTLVERAFVARPTVEEQLFYLYEDNNYKNVPSFVTTDLVLHTYHVVYDFVLRHLEASKLLPLLEEFAGALGEQTTAAYEQEPSDSPVKEALGRVAAFAAVPRLVLGQRVDVPADLRGSVEADLAEINAHQGRAKSSVGSLVDFTQFNPRGHYTRTEDLQRYFRAMMWYGQVPFDLAADGQPTEALLLTDFLAQSNELRTLWAKLYEPTTYFVGEADDLTPQDLADLSARAFGDAGDRSRFADLAKQATWLADVKQDLRGPGIENEMLIDGQEVTQGQQLRLMGQRYLPDSRMLQELTYPKVGTREAPRLFPLGLDVMAVLGSERAATLLDALYDQNNFANYLIQRQKLKAEFASLSDADWVRNLYFGWLWVLQPLTQPAPEGYPRFMRNDAWLDKQLVTALASWTELRHDTLLYGKQSVAEAGGDQPEPLAGYVEPKVEVYERLAFLLNLTRDGLKQRGIIENESDLDYVLDGFATACDQLAEISAKELAGTPLTVDELDTIRWIGSSMEATMLAAAQLEADGAPRTWWNIENKTDRNMALVADVHTSGDAVLQEAVGPPAEIWVIAPFKDRLVAFRGASFQYYEFLHPSADRLTDEAWQASLARDDRPDPVEWSHSYLLPPGISEPMLTRAPGE